MFSNFSLLRHLVRKHDHQGFTLIELLVVVIILGVLAAIAIPNLLGQIGKAREAELKNAIGTINRAQQAYHWEFSSFANTEFQLSTNIGQGSILDLVTILPSGTPQQSTTVITTNTQAVDDSTRALSGGTFYQTGGYESIVCITDSAQTTGIAPIVASGLSCAAGTTQLR
jgi:type IV pilus assembly protein PilA